MKNDSVALIRQWNNKLIKIISIALCESSNKWKWMNEKIFLSSSTLRCLKLVTWHPANPWAATIIEIFSLISLAFSCWQFVDLSSIQSSFVHSFRQRPGVKLLNGNSFSFFFYFDTFRESRNEHNGCWNRGLTTRTKRCRLTRNWPEGAPKSFNFTTVNRCVETTASCLCTKGPQNLRNKKESQRDSRWLKHDRSKGYNVSYDSDLLFNILPFSLALLT